MDLIIVEFRHDQTPGWLGEMVDEFTEDPYCHGVLVGGDERSVLFLTIWASDVAQQVAESLSERSPSSASIRRVALSVPAPQPAAELP